jgi:hypothetical protein
LVVLCGGKFKKCNGKFKLTLDPALDVFLLKIKQKANKVFQKEFS